MIKVENTKMKRNRIFIIIAIVVVAAVIAGLISIIVKDKNEAKTASQNTYNMAFYEVVDYVQNVETYLAKSLISSTPEHGAETLTNVWREANLAQAYLSQLPIESQELENTEKFLNQVSDYSYSLSRKNIYNESLTDEDLKNLKDLHTYSVELENTLNQLSEDINSGRIKWGEISNKVKTAFAQQVSTSSMDGFSNLEENFHQYSGLIYDGAFSDHITNGEKKGLTGDDIDEETAKQKAIDFIGKDNVKDVENLGYSENATIPEYNFSVKTNSEDSINISISKKGGHIVYMNSNRSVNAETISQEEANAKGKEFLNNHLDYEMIDYGTTSEESVDYPDFGISLGEAVAKGNTDLGIAICGSGIGISIACNKVKGIRCAKVSNKQEAKYTRNDNDANIIALSAEVPEEEALEIITTFINTPFSNEERHIRRINKIKEYEEKHEW